MRETSEDINPIDTLFSDSCLQNCEKIHFPCLSQSVATLLWQLEVTNTVSLHSPIFSHFYDINSRVKISHADSFLWWLWGILFPEPIIFKVSLDSGREGRATALERILFFWVYQSSWRDTMAPKVEAGADSYFCLQCSFLLCLGSLFISRHSTGTLLAWICTKPLTKGISQFLVPVPTLCEMFHIRGSVGSSTMQL